MDRTQVNGVAVVTVVSPAKAMMYGTAGDVAREIAGLEEVLLADETTVYRCAKDPENCDWSNANPRPVISHFRAHSAAAKLKQAEKELAAMRAKKEKEFQNRSNGVRRANEAKKANPPAPKPKTTAQLVKELEIEFTNLGRAIAAARKDMNTSLDEILKMAKDLATVVGQHLGSQPTDIENLSPDEKLALLRKLVG